MPWWVEWIGYIASLIVLVSLVMSSVKRLRWINLVGSLVFATYGILIKSYPVAVMNFGIVIVNCYYLYNMYKQKDALKIIAITEDNGYLETFLNYFKKDIKQFIHTPLDHLNDKQYVKFFVICNTVPAGLFIGKQEKDTLHILVDYTTPMYRDFKIGSFIYEEQQEVFKKMGVHYFLSEEGTPKHKSYLERMGFVYQSDNKLMKKKL